MGCFSSVNVCSGPKEDKLLLSGLHVVCDLFCKNCHTVIGWKYVTKSSFFAYYSYNRIKLTKSHKSIKKESSFSKNLNSKKNIGLISATVDFILDNFYMLEHEEICIVRNFTFFNSLLIIALRPPAIMETILMYV